MKLPWLYECVLLNEVTGQRRTLLVEISEAEQNDAFRHLVLRGANGPGGPDGPIAKGYAFRHAARLAPSGFIPIDAAWRLQTSGPITNEER